MEGLIERLETMIKQLEVEDKAESEKSNERWRPEVGQEFWNVTPQNGRSKNMWHGDAFDVGCWELGNCFKTEEEAELHRLRLESMANRWRPEEDQKFYVYYPIYRENGLERYIHKYDFNYYWIGNCHKTEKDAQKWYEKYGKAFGI